MRKYSKIYKSDTGSEFRYNYERSLLEWITRVDWDFDENDELVETKLKEAKVVDAIGLSKDNWKEDPQYWVDRYQEEINEECAFLMDGDIL